MPKVFFIMPSLGFNSTKAILAFLNFGNFNLLSASFLSEKHPQVGTAQAMSQTTLFSLFSIFSQSYRLYVSKQIFSLFCYVLSYLRVSGRHT